MFIFIVIIIIVIIIIVVVFVVVFVAVLVVFIIILMMKNYKQRPLFITFVIRSEGSITIHHNLIQETLRLNHVPVENQNL